MNQKFEIEKEKFGHQRLSDYMKNMSKQKSICEWTNKKNMYQNAFDERMSYKLIKK